VNRIFVAAVLTILGVTPAFGKDLRADKNKTVVRRVFTDILSQGNFEVAAEIYAKDYVNHETTKDLGLDESEAVDHGWRAAFPDLELTIEKEVAEGDFVTVLWRGRGTNTGSGNGLTATGKKAEGRGISHLPRCGWKDKGRMDGNEPVAYPSPARLVSWTTVGESIS
jgi:predicted SnoaL-like aldol condensation-catalyzing enzyme